MFCTSGHAAGLKEEDKEWQKLQKSVDETWKNNLSEIEKQWDEVQAQQRREFEEFKKKVKRVWGEAGITSTPKDWIDYDRNFLGRSHIDFEKGKMEIEALVPATAKNPRKMAEDLIAKKMQSTFSSRDLEKRGILANQLKTSSGLNVTPGNLRNYIDSDVLPGMGKSPSSVVGNDGRTRLRFNAEIPLVPNHLRIRAERYKEPVQENALRFSLRPELIMAIIHTESYFNPHAVSGAGAYGLMQLIPRYGAREAYQFLYKEDRIITPRYLYDPPVNITLGSAYLYLLHNRHLADIPGPDKRLYLTICGYNWGPTAIRKKIIKRHKISSMGSQSLYWLLVSKTPQETSDYLKKVTERSGLYTNLF
jgi:membrane-bound lytic murein transglycosylase C